MPGITIHEFDILRGPEHDLSLPDAWDNLATLVVRPNTVFISSPPCATFSRSRHRKPGPPPLRTAEFPRGFPWLKDKFYLEVQSANFLVDNTLRLAAAAAQVGNAFLIEHPEDLGLAEDGSRPSSIWQWPEMLELIACHNSLSFAVFQCEYGADTSKPTRFVTNLSSFQKQPPPYAKLPWFSPQGRYQGPLPPSRGAWLAHRQRCHYSCLAHFAISCLPRQVVPVPSSACCRLAAFRRGGTFLFDNAVWACDFEALLGLNCTC